MDPSMFVTYSPQANVVPLESKLATYMVRIFFGFVLNIFIYLKIFIVNFQNRQSPATTLNANVVTKHLSNLSLESSKKATASPEFVPGRGLAGSTSSSPNLFANSYHSQENVGGTTYFYVNNTADNVADDGNEVVRFFF